MNSPRQKLAISSEKNAYIPEAVKIGCDHQSENCFVVHPSNCAFEAAPVKSPKMRFHPDEPRHDWNRGTNCRRTERRYRSGKSSCSSFGDAPAQNRANSDKYQWPIAELRQIRRGDRQASYDSERDARLALGESLDQTNEHEPETDW